MSVKQRRQPAQSLRSRDRARPSTTSMIVARSRRALSERSSVMDRFPLILLGNPSLVANPPNLRALSQSFQYVIQLVHSLPTYCGRAQVEPHHIGCIEPVAVSKKANVDRGLSFH